jgi:WD40 repeat protein
MTAAIGEEPELLGRGSYWAIIDVDPTGHIVAAGFENGVVALFDADTRRELRRWKAHLRLAAPAFSPDGMELATAGSDSVVRIWSLPEGRLKTTLRGHRLRVYNLAHSRDGRRLVTGSGDHTATVWDLENGVALSSFSEHRGIPSKLAFHPDGRSIITSGTEGRVMVWDAVTGGRTAEFHGHRGDVMSLAITPDGREVVTGEFDGTIRKWAWGTDDVGVFRSNEVGSLSADVFTLPDFDVDPSGRYLATFNGLSFPEGRVLMVQDVHHHPASQLPSIPFLSAVTFGDSTTILTATERGNITRRQVTDGDLSEIDFVTAERPVFSLAFDRGRGILASGEDDGFISLRTFPLTEPLQSWRGHDAAVRVLEFNASGTILASADSTGRVRLWSPATGDSMAVLPSLESAVTDMAFHPREQVLAITTAAGAALLWRLGRGGACDTLLADGSGAASVIFDREGRRIVLGNDDGLIHFLDFERRSPIVKLHGHLARVTALRFSPDGRTLTSCSFDGTMRIWDTGSAAANP